MKNLCSAVGFLALALGLLSGLAITSPSARAAGAKPAHFEIEHPGSPYAVKLLAGGDSLVSGWNAANPFSGISGGNFVMRYSRVLGYRLESNVIGHNVSVAGTTIQAIFDRLDKKYRADIAEADYILLDGGGNDLINATMKKSKECDAAAYEDTYARVYWGWHSILKLVKTYAKPKAVIRVMNLYFPKYDKYMNQGCPNGERTGYTMLREFARLNHTVCSIAREYGAKCADTFAEINCSDADREDCAWNKGESLATYQKRLFKLAEKGVIRDPKVKIGVGGGLFTLLQGDEIHPNGEGHARIADAFLRTGIKN